MKRRDYEYFDKKKLLIELNHPTLPPCFDDMVKERVMQSMKKRKSKLLD